MRVLFLGQAGRTPSGAQRGAVTGTYRKTYFDQFVGILMMTAGGIWLPVFLVPMGPDPFEPANALLLVHALAFMATGGCLLSGRRFLVLIGASLLAIVNALGLLSGGPLNPLSLMAIPTWLCLFARSAGLFQGKA
jgi:hypothetical protein